MLILHLKKVYRRPVIMCLVALFSLTLGYYLFAYKSEYDVYFQGGMCLMLQAIPYIFLFMMFISYEIFYTFQKTEFNEMVCSRYLNIKCQKYDFLLITLYGMAASFAVFFSLIRHANKFGFDQLELHGYFFRLTVIFVLLPVILAELIGWSISCVKNRMIGICILLICFYCFDTTFLQSIVGLDINNEQIFKFGTLFALFDTQECGAITDSFYLMSAENVHIYRVLFWIFGALSVILLMAKKRIRFVFSVIVALGCLILFWQPSGASYALPVVNGFDRWLGEQYYYTVKQQKADKSKYILKNRDDFSVLKYDMDLSIKDVLRAKVDVVLSTNALESYQFTLYHSYKLKSVQNQDGDKLEYTQNGDYVEVINKEKNLKSITFEYEGANQYFYSTSQGIHLPANYAYYPMPGWRTTFIRDENNVCFAQEVLKEDAEFTVKIEAPEKLKIYTNFEKKSLTCFKGYNDIQYQGKSNGLTIVGSCFLKDMKVGRVTVIYSYLDEEYNPEDPETYEQYHSSFERMNLLSKDMTFFATPQENYDNVCFGNNQILDQIFKLEEDYKTYCRQGNVYYIPDEEDEEMMNKAIEMLQ